MTFLSLIFEDTELDAGNSRTKDEERSPMRVRGRRGRKRKDSVERITKELSHGIYVLFVITRKSESNLGRDLVTESQGKNSRNIGNY
ncbi:hypothetical protein J6590_067629 [Homalodisca vitripennis]|nr:hypothetical protein J6590_067629 [Homalodisca vitripennis]